MNGAHSEQTTAPRVRRGDAPRRPLGRGFTLVEVMLAVGIFAFAVAALLALLPASGLQTAAAREAEVAARLPEAVRLQLQRLVPHGSYAAFAGVALVAERDGTQVRPAPAAPDGLEQYYLIEVTPFPAEGPLGHHPATPLLAVRVAVTWPHRPPSAPGTVAPATRREERERFAFNLALRP